ALTSTTEENTNPDCDDKDGNASDDSDKTLQASDSRSKSFCCEIPYRGLQYKPDGSNQKDILIATRFLVEKFKDVKAQSETREDYTPDLFQIGKAFKRFSQELARREPSLVFVTSTMLSSLHNRMIEEYSSLMRFLDANPKSQNPNIKWRHTCLSKLARDLVRLNKQLDKIEYQKLEPSSLQWSRCQLESIDALSDVAAPTLTLSNTEANTTTQHVVPPSIADQPDATKATASADADPQVTSLTKENLRRHMELTEPKETKWSRRDSSRIVEGVINWINGRDYHQQSKKSAPSRTLPKVNEETISATPLTEQDKLPDLTRSAPSVGDAEGSHTAADDDEPQPTNNLDDVQSNFEAQQVPSRGDTNECQPAGGAQETQSSSNAKENQPTGDSKGAEPTNDTKVTRPASDPIKAPIEADNPSDTNQDYQALLGRMDEMAKVMDGFHISKDQAHVLSQKVIKLARSIYKKHHKCGSLMDLMIDLSDSEDSYEDEPVGATEDSYEDELAEATEDVSFLSTAVPSTAHNNSVLDASIETLLSQTGAQSQPLDVISESVASPGKEPPRTIEEANSNRRNSDSGGAGNRVFAAVPQRSTFGIVVPFTKPTQPLSPLFQVTNDLDHGI
ncbi:hypothetical protein BGX26_001046, partial [Mortierella sp. AD094]